MAYDNSGLIVMYRLFSANAYDHLIQPTSDQRYLNGNTRILPFDIWKPPHNIQTTLMVPIRLDGLLRRAYLAKIQRPEKVQMCVCASGEIRREKWRRPFNSDGDIVTWSSVEIPAIFGWCCSGMFKYRRASLSNDVWREIESNALVSF